MGRPWFIVAVVVLAFNDHVLKGVWPGWVSGKLSDVAGVVVIGTLLAVLSGPTWGVVLAGVGFAALKTVPGVAELAAPLLGGGVALRDPSDLIALGALPLLWWLLRHERPELHNRDRRGRQAIGLVAAVLATTATSQASPHYVILGSGTGAVYARVDPGSGFDDVFLASTDGGRTWARTPAPASSAVDWDLQRPGSEIAAQVCAADDTCFRIRFGENGTQVVERSETGLSWQVDGELPYNVQPDLAIDSASSDRVVALGSERTVLSRRAAGDWMEVDLAPLAAPPAWQLAVVTTMASSNGVIATFFIALLLILLLVPWLSVRLLLAVIDVIICGFCLVTLHFFVATAVARTVIGWLVAVAVLGALTRLTWWAERRSQVVTTPPPAHPGLPADRVPAGRAGRRRLLLAGAVVVGVLALAAGLVGHAGEPGGMWAVSVWLGSRTVTLVVGTALSILGWVALPTLSARWLAQVCILFSGIVVSAESPLHWLVLAGAPTGWLTVAWAALTVAGIMLARSASRQQRGIAPTASPSGPGFDPPTGAR